MDLTIQAIPLVGNQRMQQERAYHHGSYAWKIPACQRMPKGLALFADTRDLRLGQAPDHYLLCPQSDMS